MGIDTARFLLWLLATLFVLFSSLGVCLILCLGIFCDQCMTYRIMRAVIYHFYSTCFSCLSISLLWVQWSGVGWDWMIHWGTSFETYYQTWLFGNESIIARRAKESLDDIKRSKGSRTHRNAKKEASTESRGWSARLEIWRLGEWLGRRPYL